MEAIVFCGVQGTGKSTFYREHFFHTHLRLSLDMLRTRYREGVLLRACLDAKQRFVVDNTNPTQADRARYTAPARLADFRVIGYYFESEIQHALTRNAARPAPHRVPDRGVLGTHRRLKVPTLEEGFDELFYVRIAEGGGFEVEPWKREEAAGEV